MVAYAQQEMVGITELSKSLSGYIEKVSSHAVEKLAVVRHNKPEVVILGIAEYERMKELQDYLEDLEIAQIIKERVLDSKEPVKMLTEDDLQEYLKKRGVSNV
ncbi:MAG: type II toxin-antitoxin system Phd/YefM family antitoxin [Arcobacteraceae bacterium]|jgi:prevent-host-death family protein